MGEMIYQEGAPGPGHTAEAAESVARWRSVRGVLTEHRHRLSGVAARLYPDLPRAGDSDLLCWQQWLPQGPLALDDVALGWASGAPEPVADGTGPASAHVRPAGDYPTYSSAIAGLDPPALFENRLCYRLTGGRLLGEPALEFALTSYFDAVNLGHAVAHELTAAWRRRPGRLSMADLPLRAHVGDPCDLPRRPAMVAVTALTLRREPGGGASFLLHWRDPAKVNHAGGLYQVMPVGLFQPVGDSEAGIANDFSLWRCLAREFSEELLGTSEEYQAPGGVLDYHRWPFCQRLDAAKQAGKVAVHCLGLGVDPLTFATDILVAAVFDGDVYDGLFGGLVAHNAEGRVVAGADSAGIPFGEAAVARFTGGGERMQASGVAVLGLAWRHRRHLLG
jgi:hypothetical protein